MLRSLYKIRTSVAFHECLGRRKWATHGVDPAILGSNNVLGTQSWVAVMAGGGGTEAR
jgi:hypothetical protein